MKIFQTHIYTSRKMLGAAIVLLVATGIFMSSFGFKPKQKQQFIKAIINNKQINYTYQLSGKYDSAKHTISLKAADTLGDDARKLVINIQLSKDSTPKNIKLPRTFSIASDSLLKQKIFASMHWDNAEDYLYENYTWRRTSDLKITLQSFSKDSFLTGSFSGTLYNLHKKARIRQGSFQFYLKNR